MFTNEVQEVFASGGIHFKNHLVKIKFRCFIADAPARAFILNHKGHMSSKPCSKCKVIGSRFEGRMIFRGTDHCLRTDIEYDQELEDDHHKEGGSPLTLLRIGRVTGVPYDEMHLVFLGVMKKLIEAGVDGKFSRAAKWSGRQISVISSRLKDIGKLCPREFSRPPRPISEFKRYKATEFRQFLLYTGPVVLYGVLESDYYLHFLLLHIAIRILSTSSASPEDLLFAEYALKLFVTSAEDLYGPAFLSYNVHGLLHLVDGYRRFGALDSFSAFPYENNMPIFRKYVRNQHCPLQQFARRLMERDCYTTFNKVSHSHENRLLGMHNAGPLPENCDASARQFAKLKSGKKIFSINDGNNTVMLKDGSLCEICNILDIGGHQVLVARKFNTVQNLYNLGRSSSSVGIFKCTNVSSDIELVAVSDVAAKCYRMPLWSGTGTNSNRVVVVIMTLLHHA
ncbi:uncharacterized protein LOC124302169 [Neodiprion virginianus]|uniref:uncharacterized protein LOC124298629 n=1 Tax=Neodiprion virginianus TaxID=2961670 RepID=UPI001EE7190A|nr:uncharacterized protein LOC124298629 [Neodiprion virginianus]XP_046613972.1 uncharacterized protein LOC124302169 [Neodiprion virginianus]